MYDFETKCIKLLDDGNPCSISDYNFGSNPELLFRPCNVTDDDICFVGDDGQGFLIDPFIRLPEHVKPLASQYPKYHEYSSLDDPEITEDLMEMGIDS